MDLSNYTILIVDDTETNIDVLLEILGDDYNLSVAMDGKRALSLISERKPDIILLDIMMPEIDGYEVCRRLKADETTSAIPIIFLTAKVEENEEAKGLALGAVDYITKPISPPILKERIKNHLELKVSRDLLKNQNEILEEKVIMRTQQLGELQDVTMVAMGALAESRDPETGNHIRRTQFYINLLAQKLQDHPRFKHILSPEIITLMTKSAPLHDIGKVGVPDHILLKPGKLTNEEFKEMERHVIHGRNAIVAAEQTISKSDNFLFFAKEITYSHHEKWDGSGYPEGLTGDDIPVSARLMAIADVYDALISRRVYKPPFSHEKSLSIMQEGKGFHFDPDMIDAFLEISDQFYAIAQKYKDPEEVINNRYIKTDQTVP
jgi:putative two-component system response regulator